MMLFMMLLQLLDWEADMVVGNAVAPFEFQLASDISRDSSSTWDEDGIGYQ